MATTPGQPPGIPIQTHPGQGTQPPSVSLPSSVQRIDVPINPVNVPGTTMVRVSQPTGQPQIPSGIPTIVSRPQIVTSTPGGGTIFQTGNLQSLGLMVTKFPPSGDPTRPQIILQPRTGVRPVVVTSTAGGQFVHQSPLNRPPGIRTIVHSGGLPPGTVTVPAHGHIGQGQSVHPPSSGTIQVMNLSVPTNVSQSGVVTSGTKQQATATFIRQTFGNHFDGQTVNLILSDPPRTPIRLSSELIKTATSAGVAGNRYPRVSVSNVGMAGVGVSTAPKILNLGSAVSVTAPIGSNVGVNSTGHHPTQVTRLNIIHPGSAPGGPGHSMVVGTAPGQGKQGVINIAPGQKHPQTVILNPATNQIMTASGPGMAKLNQQGVKTTVVMNQGSVIGQQQAHLNHSVINASALRGIPGIGPSGQILSHGIVSQHSSQLQQHPSIVAITSPMKSSSMGSHVQSAVTASPIKSNLMTNPTPPSPRPSILARKRNLDSNLSSSQGSVGRSPIKSGLAEGLAAKVEAELTESGAVSLTSSQQSSSSCGPATSSHPSQTSSSQSTLTASSQQSDGSATPRKKPRKQLLEPFNLSTSANMKLLTAGSSDESSQVQQQNQKRLEPPTPAEESDDVRAVRHIEPVDPLIKKFRPALYQSVIPPWKSLQHHFLRYTDVKPRAEKRMTLAELSNEGAQKMDGWKIHHLATQMEEIGQDETNVLERLKKLLAVLEEKADANNSPQETSNGATNGFLLGTPEKVIDLVRGNIQRSSIFKEEMKNSEQLLIKLTNDHRGKIDKLTQKNMHKRTCISK